MHNVIKFRHEPVIHFASALTQLKSLITLYLSISIEEYDFEGKICLTQRGENSVKEIFKGKLQFYLKKLPKAFRTLQYSPYNPFQAFTNSLLWGEASFL